MQRTPWDGREPIIDAIERYGLRDDFHAAIRARNREAAVLILYRVGADAELAFDILATLITEPDGRQHR
jgi:hypothetical protein